MVSSLSDNIIKQYNTTYKKWWTFCQSNLNMIFQPSTQDILRFLSQEYQNKSSYNTLNTHRSALNILTDSGKSKLIERFMKGTFKCRPSFPKYEEIWDPHPVLVMLGNLYPLHDLDLKTLSIKLI